jgi:cell division protease FtsH
LGKEIATEKNYSESTAIDIDHEVERFVRRAYEAAKKVIQKNRKALDYVAETLLKKETIEKDEFDSIIKKFSIKPIEA